MSLVTHSFDLSIMPGSIPPIVHVSEYDIGRTYTVTINGENGSAFNIPTGTTATVEGTLNGAIGFTTDATISGSTVSFTLTESMTAVSGKAWCKIKLTLNDEPIQTCAFVLAVDRAGVEAETVIGADGFDTIIQDAVDNYLEDHPIVVDPTLAISGAAADAKATGDEIGDLKSALSQYTVNLSDISKWSSANNSMSVSDAIASNTKTDTSTALNLQIRTYNGSTLVDRVYSSYETAHKKVVAFTASGNADAIRLMHSGATQDLYVTIPTQIVSGEVYTVSLDIKSANPTIVGGVIFADIQTEKGATATNYIPHITATDFVARNKIADSAVGDSIYCAIGDSITAGSYSENGHGIVATDASWSYPRRIERHYGCKVYNLGVPGAKLTEMLPQANAVNANSNIVTIMGGTTDYVNSVPLGSISDSGMTTVYGALKTLVETVAAKAPFARIVLISPFIIKYGTINTKWSLNYNNGSFTYEQLATAFKNVAEYYNLEYLDGTHSGPTNILNISTAQEDGIHPTKEFYKTVETFVSQIF